MSLQGFLKIGVLSKLAEQPMSGYGLMKALEKTLGKKPSSGSIYPLLKSLLENEFVHMEEEENKKVYSITDKGRQFLADFKSEKTTFMGHMHRMHSFFSTLGENSPKQKLCSVMIQHMEKGELPFRELQESMEEFMNTVAKKVLEEKVEQEKIAHFLKDTSKKLEDVQ